MLIEGQVSKLVQRWQDQEPDILVAWIYDPFSEIHQGPEDGRLQHSMEV